MTRRRLLLLLPFPSFAVLVAAIGWWLSAPTWTGPVTDHFDGHQFLNRAHTERPGLVGVARQGRDWARGPWDAWRENTPQAPPPTRVEGGGLRATFVNHSTFLLQVDGLNILTDPIWSDRCSAVSFVGPMRRHAPGLDLDTLPPIDLVLLSHNHYDHLDLPTLQRLKAHSDPLILAGLGNAALLKGAGLERVLELDWGDTAAVGPLRIIAQETRHFSGRGLFDRMGTLWVGFVIDAPSGRIYVAGDTGAGPHFAASGETWGPFRLALLPIGAYLPRDFMAPVHIDPIEAVAAHQALRAQTSLGMHFGTFRLSSEAQDDPPRALAAAREAAGLHAVAFFTLAPGAGLAVP